MDTWSISSTAFVGGGDVNELLTVGFEASILESPRRGDPYPLSKAGLVSFLIEVAHRHMHDIHCVGPHWGPSQWGLGPVGSSGPSQWGLGTHVCVPTIDE